MHCTYTHVITGHSGYLNHREVFNIVCLLRFQFLRRRLLCFSWPLRNETRPHAGGAHWTYGGAHSQPHDNETAIDQQQAARRACERSWVRATAVSTDKADALAQGARVGQQDDSHRAARPLPRHAGAA